MRLLYPIFTLWLLASCQQAPQVPADAALKDSEDIEDGEEEESGVVLPEKEEVVDGEPETPAEPIALTADVIKTLCAGAKLTKTEVVTIPARAGGCMYNNNGNGPATNGAIAARETDTATVPLTPDMVVCDVGIVSRVPTLFFNDDMYFLMDKYVIASDIQQFVTKLEVANGLPLWDFTKIFGSNNLNSDQKIPYCAAGAGTCVTQEIPSTEFRSALTSAQIAPIAAELVEKENFTLSLIVTGDDPGTGDCIHDEYPLDVKVDYVQNPNIIP
jgi:hypothetical protein